MEKKKKAKKVTKKSKLTKPEMRVTMKVMTTVMENTNVSTETPTVRSVKVETLERNAKAETISVKKENVKKENAEAETLKKPALKTKGNFLFS